MVEDSKAAEKRRRAEALRANLRRRKAATSFDAAATRSPGNVPSAAETAGSTCAIDGDKRG